MFNHIKLDEVEGGENGGENNVSNPADLMLDYSLAVSGIIF